MRDLAVLFLHLLATAARPAGRGGARSVVAEDARHKDIRTTERHMTATEDRLKALMAKMANRGG